MTAWYLTALNPQLESATLFYVLAEHIISFCA
jgi:hypothetical protein